MLGDALFDSAEQIKSYLDTYPHFYVGAARKEAERLIGEMDRLRAKVDSSSYVFPRDEDDDAFDREVGIARSILNGCRDRLLATCQRFAGCYAVEDFVREIVRRGGTKRGALACAHQSPYPFIPFESLAKFKRKR